MKRWKIGIALAAVMFLVGASYVFPSAGLYWFTDSDPTSNGVFALNNQLLVRTDTPSIYYKSGPGSTDWTQIGGGSASTTNIVNNVVNTSSNTSIGYFFGDGSDGDCIFDGVNPVAGISPTGPEEIPVGEQTTKGAGQNANAMVYTLPDDIFCDDATLSTGVGVQLDGWRFFAKGTLTIPSGAYVGAWGGNGGDGTNVASGTQGASRGANMCGGSGLGGLGGNTSTGVATGGGTSASMPNDCTGGTTTAGNDATGFCNGGGGGDGDGGAGGGNGGTGTLAASSQGSLHVPVQAQTCQFKVATTRFTGGTGGGGGRGDQFAPTGGGGGGGGGAGPAIIMARNLDCESGTLSSHGGHGGNGFQFGGGGGGGGGAPLIVFWGTGTLCITDVNGGTAGAVGSAGAPGTDGGNGSDGILYQFGVN